MFLQETKKELCCNLGNVLVILGNASHFSAT